MAGWTLLRTYIAFMGAAAVPGPDIVTLGESQAVLILDLGGHSGSGGIYSRVVVVLRCSVSIGVYSTAGMMPRWLRVMSSDSQKSK